MVRRNAIVIPSVLLLLSDAGRAQQSITGLYRGVHEPGLFENVLCGVFRSPRKSRTGLPTLDATAQATRSDSTERPLANFSSAA